MGWSPASDGYQYGVMFSDGAVVSPWVGAAQRTRAEVTLFHLRDKDSAGTYRLARRGRRGSWRVVQG